jgi:hypothetical protein
MCASLLRMGQAHLLRQKSALGAAGLSASLSRLAERPLCCLAAPLLNCRHEKDTAVILGKERERLEEEAAAAAAAAERLEAVLGAVARAADASLALDEVEEVYRGLRGHYREEYVMYNLAAAALAQVCEKNRIRPKAAARNPCRFPCPAVQPIALCAFVYPLARPKHVCFLNLSDCPFHPLSPSSPCIAGATAAHAAAAGVVPPGRPRRPGRRLCQLAAPAGKRGGGPGLGAGGCRGRGGQRRPVHAAGGGDRAAAAAEGADQRVGAPVGGAACAPAARFACMPLYLACWGLLGKGEERWRERMLPGGSQLHPPRLPPPAGGALAAHSSVPTPGLAFTDPPLTRVLT